MSRRGKRRDPDPVPPTEVASPTVVAPAPETATIPAATAASSTEPQFTQSEIIRPSESSTSQTLDASSQKVTENLLIIGGVLIVLVIIGAMIYLYRQRKGLDNDQSILEMKQDEKLPDDPATTQQMPNYNTGSPVKVLPEEPIYGLQQNHYNGSPVDPMDGSMHMMAQDPAYMYGGEMMPYIDPSLLAYPDAAMPIRHSKILPETFGMAPPLPDTFGMAPPLPDAYGNMPIHDPRFLHSHGQNGMYHGEY